MLKMAGFLQVEVALEYKHLSQVTSSCGYGLDWPDLATDPVQDKI